MANGDFVSQYTGAQIEQAISAYLNGDTRSTIVVKVSSDQWQDKPDSISLDSKYYIKIQCSGSSYIGHTPECFLISTPVGNRIEPDLMYLAEGATEGITEIWIGSNIKFYCDIVLIGSSPISIESGTVVVNPT